MSGRVTPLPDSVKRSATSHQVQSGGRAARPPSSCGRAIRRFVGVAARAHTTGMGLLKRIGERLAAPPEQLRAQEIRKWCDEIDDPR